jgi:hypothetical protein
MPNFRRDPFSPPYDAAAADLISRAISRYRRKQKNQRLTAWTHGIVENTLEHPLRDQGKDRLTRLERGFQRALYYDKRITNMKPGWHPDARWALKIDWDPAPLLPGRPRGFRLQVFRDTDAARYARGLPKSESYGKNPDLLAVNQDLPGSAATG